MNDVEGYLTNDARAMERAEELMAMVRARHSDARFIGPTYSPEDDLWLIDAYFDQGEDFDLQDQLSEREIDILLEDGLWMCVLCLPADAFPD